VSQIKAARSAEEVRRIVLRAGAEFDKSLGKLGRKQAPLPYPANSKLSQEEFLRQMAAYEDRIHSITRRQFWLAQRNEALRDIVLDGLKADKPYRPSIANPMLKLGEAQQKELRRFLEIVPAAQIDIKSPNPFPLSHQYARNHELMIVIDTHGYSFYDNDDQVRISTNDSNILKRASGAILYHETAHWLTGRIPGALQRCHNAFVSRTANSPESSHNGIGGYKKDRFYTTYIGRMYSKQSSLMRGHEIMDGSEIISVTAEHMYNNIYNFAKRDPQSLPESVYLHWPAGKGRRQQGKARSFAHYQDIPQRWPRQRAFWSCRSTW
jgi:hypothetical protein